MTGHSAQVHASAVAVKGHGCLITGAPGSGKSTLCFEMIALGGDLVADDRVDLTVIEGKIMMSCPPRICGCIEARGIGIVRLPRVPGQIPCELIVDLDRAAERLASPRLRDLLGISCPVIFGKGRSGLASILTVLLEQGTLLDPDDGIEP